MKAKELLRWIAALTFGGFGIYALVEMLPFLTKWDGGMLHLAVIIWMLCLCVVVPLMLAYTIFRRRFHEVCSVLAMLGAIVICIVLMGLPTRLHLNEWLSGSLMDSPVLIFPTLGLSLLFLIGPFYGAAWFYRFCMRLAARHLPKEMHRTWPGSAHDENNRPATTRNNQAQQQQIALHLLPAKITPRPSLSGAPHA